MGKRKFSVYLHLVWATWNRESWISPHIERRIFRNIVNQIHKHGCKVIVIIGTPNHIHILIKYSPTITIAKRMKQVKGVSSHFINSEHLVDDHFQWQIGYGAFSVSRWDTDKIASYIRNQKRHHSNHDLVIELEEI
jgi:REP element-mobilizing transposase RayT